MSPETMLGPLPEQIGPTTVIGHKNPDTDSIAAAIGYAWLLQERDKLAVQPARAGQLNPQTTFALEHFGLESPPILTDASPRFVHIARPLPPLAPTAPLQEAWALMARAHLVAPVVTADRRPGGLVTSTSLFHFLAHGAGPMLGPAASLEETPLGQILHLPCGAATEPDVPRFSMHARLKDKLNAVLRDERDVFWVIDDAEEYLGVCTKADMLHPPQMKLILVDHNEVGQAISGLEDAVLLEVLDHHRLANPPTHMPITFHADPVGSSSTLVAERVMRSGLPAPRPIAGALLSGLLSDTLLLKSPTTTGRDRVAAMQLAAWAFPEQSDPYQQMMDYGWRLLAAGAGLQGRTARAIIDADFKDYEAANLRFGVAQVEVTDLAGLDERLAELGEALARRSDSAGLDFSVLMVTDIVLGNSRLLLSKMVPALEEFPFARRPEGTFDMPGIVSRKKQLLPALLTALN